MRDVTLDSPKDLDLDDVRALLEASLQLARSSLGNEGPEFVIQSVSSKQRPRR